MAYVNKKNHWKSNSAFLVIGKWYIIHLRIDVVYNNSYIKIEISSDERCTYVYNTVTWYGYCLTISNNSLKYNSAYLIIRKQDKIYINLVLIAFLQ